MFPHLLCLLPSQMPAAQGTSDADAEHTILVGSSQQAIMDLLEPSCDGSWSGKTTSESIFCSIRPPEGSAPIWDSRFHAPLWNTDHEWRREHSFLALMHKVATDDEEEFQNNVLNFYRPGEEGKTDLTYEWKFTRKECCDIRAMLHEWHDKILHTKSWETPAWLTKAGFLLKRRTLQENHWDEFSHLKEPPTFEPYTPPGPIKDNPYLHDDVSWYEFYKLAYYRYVLEGFDIQCGRKYVPFQDEDPYCEETKPERDLYRFMDLTWTQIRWKDTIKNKTFYTHPKAFSDVLKTPALPLSRAVGFDQPAKLEHFFYPHRFTDDLDSSSFTTKDLRRAQAGLEMKKTPWTPFRDPTLRLSINSGHTHLPRDAFQPIPRNVEGRVEWRLTDNAANEPEWSAVLTDLPSPFHTKRVQNMKLMNRCESLPDLQSMSSLVSFFGTGADQLHLCPIDRSIKESERGSLTINGLPIMNALRDKVAEYGDDVKHGELLRLASQWRLKWHKHLSLEGLVDVVKSGKSPYFHSKMTVYQLMFWDALHTFHSHHPEALPSDYTCVGDALETWWHAVLIDKSHEPTSCPLAESLQPYLFLSFHTYCESNDWMVDLRLEEPLIPTPSLIRSWFDSWLLQDRMDLNFPRTATSRRLKTSQEGRPAPDQLSILDLVMARAKAVTELEDNQGSEEARGPLARLYDRVSQGDGLGCAIAVLAPMFLVSSLADLYVIGFLSTLKLLKTANQLSMLARLVPDPQDRLGHYDDYLKN